MREIRGKSALVTGAASGIGRAMTIALAREGTRLWIVDINEDGLDAVAAEARQLGVEVVARRCDVAEPAQVTAVTAEILDKWNGVDILFNNAGITYYGKMVEMSDEHWDRVLRINLHAQLQFARELLQSLLARPEAHIVNTCSMFGLFGAPKLVAYCTTKFALVGFSDALRAEYGRDGLGVTALCPGFVRTNLFTSAPQHTNAKGPKIPPRLFSTTPERVAKAAVRAIRGDRRLVVVEPFARLTCTVKRLFPGLINFFFHLGQRKRVAKKIARLELKRATKAGERPVQRDAA
jgi:short-subunit dehydrogenase